MSPSLIENSSSSTIGSESVFSHVGPQPQKSIHGSFLFTLVLFTPLQRRVAQLPKPKDKNVHLNETSKIKIKN